MKTFHTEDNQTRGVNTTMDPRKVLAYRRIPTFPDALMHKRIHEHRYSATGKHLTNIHGGIDTSSLNSYFALR